jgi:hypothetical protein
MFPPHILFPVLSKKGRVRMAPSAGIGKGQPIQRSAVSVAIGRPKIPAAVPSLKAIGNGKRRLKPAIRRKERGK